MVFSREKKAQNEKTWETIKGNETKWEKIKGHKNKWEKIKTMERNEKK